MIIRTTRLRWRRVFRRKQRQVEDIGFQAEETIERHFVKRLNRLIDVRRFVTGWVLLFVLLCSALVWQLRVMNRTFQSVRPVAGGSFSEGMLGNFTNANPLYATKLADATVARLLFSGLLTYNSNNQLVGDLAQSWTADEQNTVYTVKLKPDLTWHDGAPLTAADVAYTFRVAQTPDAKSPLFRSWNGVDIKELDSLTVQFTLKAPFAPFLHSLTTGIIPKHILGNTPMAELRSSQFNTIEPVGSGPFRWSSVELGTTGKHEGEQNIGLKPFEHYHRGRTKLDSFTIRTYTNQDRLLDDFKLGQVNALVGFDRVPDALKENSNDALDEKLQTYSSTLTAETMTFFRTDSDILKDQKVRQALVRSVNIPELLKKSLEYPATIADAPILRGQVGYDASLKQLSFDQNDANKLLDDAGWKRSASGTGYRSKDGVELTIRLVGQSTPEFTALTVQLQKAWRDVGVNTTVSLLGEPELQGAIADRSYDALLYGISVGADPDVYAYWHSTQFDIRSGSRLNLSNYKSAVADKSLEAERSRGDSALRAAKYRPFLQAWRTDAPALALYQPRLLYITNEPLFGAQQDTINTSTDRFNNVQDWMVRQELRPKT